MQDFISSGVPGVTLRDGFSSTKIFSFIIDSISSSFLFLHPLFYPTYNNLQHFLRILFLQNIFFLDIFLLIPRFDFHKVSRCCLDIIHLLFSPSYIYIYIYILTLFLIVFSIVSHKVLKLFTFYNIYVTSETYITFYVFFLKYFQ